MSHVATPRSSLPLENAGHSGHRIDEVSQRGARHEGLLQVGLALCREEQCRQCRSQPAMPPLIWQGQLSGRENKKQGHLSLPGVWLAGAMPRQPPTPELPPVDKEASTAGSGHGNAHGSCQSVNVPWPAKAMVLQIEQKKLSVQGSGPGGRNA